LNRLETMVLMAGYELPPRAIRHHVSSALELIIQLERLDDGARHVTAITQGQRMGADGITPQDPFAYKGGGFDEVAGEVIGQLRATGLRPTFLPKFERDGIELPSGLFGDMANAMFGADGAAMPDAWVRTVRR